MDVSNLITKMYMYMWQPRVVGADFPSWPYVEKPDHDTVIKSMGGVDMAHQVADI